MTVESSLSVSAPESIRARRYGRGFLYALAAVAASIALALYLKSEFDQPADVALRGQLDDQGRLRPLGEVLELTRALKLVTVEVRSNVPAAKCFSNWRGTVQAQVVVPVRYVYGVDLAGVSRGSFILEAATRSYILRIPHPERFFVELDTAHPLHEDVQVSFLQFRRTGGEYWLGEARKEVCVEAERQTLPPEEQLRIERDTLEQVRGAIQKLVPEANVRVEYQ